MLRPTLLKAVAGDDPDKTNSMKREEKRWRGLLAWIDPMENALNAAEIEVYGLLNGAHDDYQFRARYPDLISTLKQFDLSPDKRLILDGDPYPVGHNIRLALEKLKNDAIDWHGQTEFPVDSPVMTVVDARYACTTRVKEIREIVEGLRRILSEQYKKTYE
ncbi:MAG: hypothetical protein ACR2HX_19480 [Pyrinomonadaceae bacterium]